ncbi:acetyl-coenzyme A transporter 1-domain-containing protein [Melampsora americana]|nr:acetyl-coenzyme A transporter 1-domain-containing protein [Melampsora americana]
MTSTPSKNRFSVLEHHYQDQDLSPSNSNHKKKKTKSHQNLKINQVKEEEEEEEEERERLMKSTPLIEKRSNKTLRVRGNLNEEKNQIIQIDHHHQEEEDEEDELEGTTLKEKSNQIKRKQLKRIDSRKPFGSESGPNTPQTSQLTLKDKKAMVLLVVLYMLQGIPVGLAFGSIPFLLRARLSYSQIGLFSLASYPYSLKLLWSPIVDSIYLSQIGRRKSWIIPVQALVGLMLWWLGNHVSVLMEADVPDVKTLTLLFFTLVLFAATQDIAVDGWALELLSKDNLSYASTAQTVGLNIGYFLSFTVFLAFNSLEFSNNRWRALFGLTVQSYPIITLSGYLKFGGICFLIVTFYLTFFQTEDKVKSNSTESKMNVKKVYQIMFEICKLKHVQSFIFLHLIVKFGTSVNDSVTSLKLLEKGLSKEDLALSVLIDFPFQIFLGYFAAKWSNGDKPLRPWIVAMWFRLFFATWGIGLVYFFPQSKPLSTSYFILVIISTVISSFASTVQFVGISAFHTQIADPLIGGTYMTLLNTVSNLGGTWPKYFVLKGVDYFTEAYCGFENQTKSLNSTQLDFQGKECVTDLGKSTCLDLNGICQTEKDGYYIMQIVCILIGAVSLALIVSPAAQRLQGLPTRAWQVRKGLRN